MGLLDCLKKIDSTLTEINNALTSIDKIFNDQHRKSEITQENKPSQSIEKSIPSPRLFDKNGREIRQDFRTR